MTSLASRVQTSASWSDIVLPEDQLNTLQLIQAEMQHRRRVYHDWGFGAGNSRGLGTTAIFSGEIGTGKTLAAEVLANSLRLDLFRIDLDAAVSKFIGETERNLRRIFDAAEAGRAVLLFDDADALFGKRSEVKDSHDRHSNVEVSYLLQRAEAYPGLVIMTSNLKDSLDSAFVRRIRFLVRFPFPRREARREIWKRTLPTAVPTKDLRFEKLAMLRVSGGTIRSIALDAASCAVADGGAITMRRLLQATRREFEKLERPLFDDEIVGWV